MICGKGVLYFKNGNCLVGHFSENSINGSAVLYIQNKNYFQGHWANGTIQGQVVYYNDDEAVLTECEFQDNTCKQQFRKVKANKLLKKVNILEFLNDALNRYDEVQNSTQVKSDKLKLVFTNFQDGGAFFGITDGKLPQGLGAMQYPDGKIDCGYYVNGQLEGYGRLEFPNNDVYDGQVKNGQLNGEGIYYKKDENQYIFGVFKNNLCDKIKCISNGFPLDAIEILRYYNHGISKNFVDKFIPTVQIKIPQFLDELQEQNQIIITNDSQLMYKQSKESFLLDKTMKKSTINNNQSHLYSLLNEIPAQIKSTNRQQSIITKSIEMNIAKQIDEITYKLASKKQILSTSSNNSESQKENINTSNIITNNNKFDIQQLKKSRKSDLSSIDEKKELEYYSASQKQIRNIKNNKVLSDNTIKQFCTQINPIKRF